MSKGRLEAFSDGVIAIPIALVAPALSMAIYFAVVVMWLVPDRRIERAIGS